MSKTNLLTCNEQSKLTRAHGAKQTYSSSWAACSYACLAFVSSSNLCSTTATSKHALHRHQCSICPGRGVGGRGLNSSTFSLLPHYLEVKNCNTEKTATSQHASLSLIDVFKFYQHAFPMKASFGAKELNSRTQEIHSHSKIFSCIVLH